jgi:hypothetical protein
MTTIKYKDEETYEYEIGPDKGEKGRCEHNERVSLHQSISIGGFNIGRCKNKALPGCCFCHLHVSRDAIPMLVDMLLRRAK